MAEQNVTNPKTEWLGSSGAASEATTASASFGGGKMWVGEHAVDGDVLIFDPSVSSPNAECLSFFSLMQLRMRAFSRQMVRQHIQQVTDSVRVARAKKDYNRRVELSEAREIDRANARVAVSDRQRQQVIERHRDYLAAHGVGYQGVRPTAPDRKAGKRTKCHFCGLRLDDFAKSTCGVCNDVLCSCGACACASRPVKVNQ